jgi:hypothetical protein
MHSLQTDVVSIGCRLAPMPNARCAIWRASRASQAFAQEGAMQLSRIDLNLFVVFDAIYSEGASPLPRAS